MTKNRIDTDKEPEKGSIEYKALVKYWMGKGLSEQEALVKVENALETKRVHREIQKLKGREASREYYRKKMENMGKPVKIRVL
jgi:hypothetical protein